MKALRSARWPRAFAGFAAGGMFLCWAFHRGGMPTAAVGKPAAIAWEGTNPVVQVPPSLRSSETIGERPELSDEELGRFRGSVLNVRRPADISRMFHSLLKYKSTPETADMMGDLVRALTDREPAAAWSLAKNLPPGTARSEALMSIAVAWGNHDLAQAVDWANQLSDSREREAALAQIAYEACREQPVEALSIAVALPAGRERDALIRHAAMRWGACSPTEAATWADQIADAPLRTRVLSSIASAWAESDPLAAGTMAANALPISRDQDNAIIAIVQRWAQKAPDEAADWIMEFPAGPLKSNALSTLLPIWAANDETGAANWLLTLAEGPERDVAQAALANRLPGISEEPTRK